MTVSHLPQPYGAVPSPRQLAWHALEFYGFLHFTVNTFTDMEWGNGDELETIFAPTDFSADQMAETAALGGMKGLILTAKHHDGFCLWPSDFTGHSVKNSPWRRGGGDVVEEVARACKEKGLKFGVYLSPWDRNHADYGRPEYVVYYRNQLRELLTRYGPIFEVWFDGANGGDGYYGGKYEQRRIDARTYYEWEQTFALVRELQPEACIFGDFGGDVRWVGNESGIAGDPCWNTYNASRAFDATNEERNQGLRGGPDWFPAECDVSIRPGWFYHAHEDDQVRTPANLLDLYFASVGRGANLLVNLPPDRRGRIHERDRAALLAFRDLRERIFNQDLARPAAASASGVRGNDAAFTASHAVDGQPDMYWCAEDGDHSPELTLRFEQPVAFNVVSLREYLPLGQRVEDFALDVWQGDDWREVYTGTAIGSRRLVRLPAQSAAGVRLRVLRSPACPAIAEFGLYLEPRGAETGEAGQE